MNCILKQVRQVPCSRVQWQCPTCEVIYKSSSLTITFSESPVKKLQAQEQLKDTLTLMWHWAKFDHTKFSSWHLWNHGLHKSIHTGDCKALTVRFKASLWKRKRSEGRNNKIMYPLTFPFSRASWSACPQTESWKSTLHIMLTISSLLLPPLIYVHLVNRCCRWINTFSGREFSSIFIKRTPSFCIDTKPGHTAEVENCCFPLLCFPWGPKVSSLLCRKWHQQGSGNIPYVSCMHMSPAD